MSISKDYSLETALRASLCDHTYLCMGARNELLGRYYLTTNKISCESIDKRYIETVEFHELMHYLLSVSTSFKRLLLFLELEAKHEGLGEGIRLIRVLGKNYVGALFSPVNEALAYYFQVMNPTIPKDLKDSLIDELSHGDKSFVGFLLTRFSEVIDKFESKFHMPEIPTEIRFTLSYNIARAILSVPIRCFFTPFFDPYQRVKILSEIEEKQIPRWKDYNQIVNMVVRVFLRNNLTFYPGDVFYSNKVDRPLENIAFWSWCIHTMQNTSFEVIEPYLFGILSEMDITFWPSYTTVTSDRKDYRCIIRQQNPDTFMGHRFIREFERISDALDKKGYTRSRKKEIVSLSMDFTDALRKVIRSREKAFSKCPKNCRLDCRVKKGILRGIKGIRTIKYFAWPS